MKTQIQQWLHRHLPAQWLDNRLFIFSVVGSCLGLFVILLAPFSGTWPIILANVITGVMLMVVSMGAVLGWSLRPLIHSLLCMAAFSLIYEAANSGGLFAAVMCWVALMPLAPMFLLPLVDAFVWFGISNLIYLGMWLAMSQGWVADELTTDAGVHWYSGVNYLLTCFTVLALPLMAERDFKRNMATNQTREQELLRTRADLLRAQSFKDSFISTLSHELRTPMNAILGFNDLLSERLQTNPQALALVNMSRQSGEHLLTVINDVLDFSQMQLGHLKIHPEPFDLRTTVRSAFMLFEQRVDSMNIDYQLILADNLPATINTDRHRLMQVLVNLLGNAIKFTHQGTVSLSVSRLDEQLLFEVRDTGIGVASDRIAHIFERFEQATAQTSSLYGGNGLGLSICSELVKLLGGTIGVHSVLGQGSCFWVRLPLQEVSIPQLALPKLSAGNHWLDVPVRFLIVDDHPLNRLLACHIVQSHWPQAELRQADNGQQALALLRENNYDMVLMDMVMPEMDGIEATVQIRQNLPEPQCHVPVVVLTANANAQDHLQAQEAGINGLMVKPFDRLKLCALIEEQLLSSSPFLQRLSDLRQSQR